MPHGSSDSCGTCRFFVRVPADADEPEIGECRHDPPRAGIDDIDPYAGVWPYIEHTSWCGQFEVIVQAAPPAPDAK